MTEWQTPRIPGVPRMPDPTQLLAQYQAQVEALAQLTPTIVTLNQALRSLTGVVETARDTVDSAQRVTAQLERIVSELEEPARALRPGLERVAHVLDDPSVAALPVTLRRVQDSLLPLLEGLARAQTRIGHLAAAATQSFVRLTAPRRAADGADDPGTLPGD
jgi:ABC-type transporter Mla subunit MlaD